MGGQQRACRAYQNGVFHQLSQYTLFSIRTHVIIPDGERAFARSFLRLFYKHLMLDLRLDSPVVISVDIPKAQPNAWMEGSMILWIPLLRGVVPRRLYPTGGI